MQKFRAQILSQERSVVSFLKNICDRKRRSFYPGLVVISSQDKLAGYNSV